MCCDVLWCDVVRRGETENLRRMVALLLNDVYAVCIFSFSIEWSFEEEKRDTFKQISVTEYESMRVEIACVKFFRNNTIHGEVQTTAKLESAISFLNIFISFLHSLRVLYCNLLKNLIHNVSNLMLPLVWTMESGAMGPEQWAACVCMYTNKLKRTQFYLLTSKTWTVFCSSSQ